MFSNYYYNLKISYVCDKKTQLHLKLINVNYI